jgi:hypothetical protein
MASLISLKTGLPPTSFKNQFLPLIDHMIGPRLLRACRPLQYASAIKGTLKPHPIARFNKSPSSFQKRNFQSSTSLCSMATIKLNNGASMPLVGFGLWKVNNDTCADQVYNAIKTGYRLFDGAVSAIFRVMVISKLTQAVR